MEEKKNCPYCGKEILAVAKKCKHCGKWLDEKSNKKTMVTCSICGESIEKGLDTCPYCHEKVVLEDNIHKEKENVGDYKQEIAANPVDKTDKITRIYYIAGLLIVAIIIGCFIYLPQHHHSKTESHEQKSYAQLIDSALYSVRENDGYRLLVKYPDSIKPCAYYVVRDSVSGGSDVCKFDAVTKKVSMKNMSTLLSVQDDEYFAEYVDTAFINPSNKNEIILLSDNMGCGYGYQCCYLKYDLSEVTLSCVDHGYQCEAKNDAIIVTKLDQCYNPTAYEAEQIWSYDRLIYDYDGTLLKSYKETPNQ